MILWSCQDARQIPDAEVAQSPPSLTEHDKSVQAELLTFLGKRRPTGWSPYGNRASFFAWTPKSHRADPDWRSVLGDWLADEEPRWTVSFEELIIRDFLRDKKGGFFLDVGCHRPKWGSTTYFLERNLGWTGIGIDALGRYARLWEEHRPTSKFLSYAIADRDGETVRFHLGTLVNSLDEEFAKSFGRKIGEIQGTTMTLDTILEQHGVEKIDFLSMDIEGGEPAALRGFDIERYKPDLCCVENVKSAEVLEYFSVHGYELIEKYKKADKINYYFRPRHRM